MRDLGNSCKNNYMGYTMQADWMQCHEIGRWTKTRAAKGEAREGGRCLSEIDGCLGCYDPFVARRFVHIM